MEIRKYKLLATLIYVLAGLTITSSCKKDNSNIGNVNLPVVESYLIPGNTIQVKLYLQKALTDTAKFGAAITSQKLYITDGTNKVQLTETANGVYTYVDPDFLVAGKTYSLTFNYQGFNISASTTMPAKPKSFTSSAGTIHFSTTTTPGKNDVVLDTLRWDNPDSLNHVLVFFNADEKDFPVNSFGSSNRPYNFTINTSRSSFFNLTQNIFPYYGPYQVVLMRVNQEYVDLLNSNTNGANTSTLNNVPTNIVNGYGIFTAMQADTVSLNVFN